MTQPGVEAVKILSSVTSTGMQKVSLSYLLIPFGIAWEIFDAPLCQLIDQSRCTVEVDFRIMDTRGVRGEGCIGEMVIVRSLVGFRERGGRIRVVRVGPHGSESVWYPPPPLPVE